MKIGYVRVSSVSQNEDTSERKRNRKNLLRKDIV